MHASGAFFSVMSTDANNPIPEGGGGIRVHVHQAFSIWFLPTFLHSWYVCLESHKCPLVERKSPFVRLTDHVTGLHVWFHAILVRIGTRRGLSVLRWNAKSTVERLRTAQHMVMIMGTPSPACALFLVCLSAFCLNVFRILLPTRAQGARKLFVGLFKNLSDLSDLAAPLIDVREESKTVFLVWRCPASGFLDATDTFLMNGETNKIYRQNVVLKTA